MSKNIIIGIIIFSLAVIGVSYFLLAGGQKTIPTIASYSQNDKEKPKIEVKTTFSDLGKMKVSEDRSANFKIKNIVWLSEKFM